MKKFFIPTLMLIAASMCLYISCSSDDDGPSQDKFSEEFFSIDNGVFHSGAMPESTSEDVITGIEVNDRALTGGSNFISITSETQYDRFFVGIEGQNGYVEVQPEEQEISRNVKYYYNIPITYGSAFSADMTMLIKARKKDGEITQAYSQTIKFIESMEGELTINLTFDQKKDLDLHLITPSGNEISWENRTWTFTDEDGNTVEYGLDHDSNPACYIDGLNNENIVIPEAAIEPGEYRVYLEMYKNCDRSIGTDLHWRLSVRYKGGFVTNTMTMPTASENYISFQDGATTVEGSNPAWGEYPYNHAGSTQKYVMYFTVKNGSRAAAPKSVCNYVLSPMDEFKKSVRFED